MLEDDPYGLVRYEGDALPSLFELSDAKIAYSSSFSKTVAPGLRVGWFVFPEALARQIEATATSTYITPVLLGQATVFEFVDRGLFDSNLAARDRAPARAPRRDARALDRELPSVRSTRPEGGYFLWLELDRSDGPATHPDRECQEPDDRRGDRAAEGRDHSCRVGARFNACPQPVPSRPACRGRASPTVRRRATRS